MRVAKLDDVIGAERVGVMKIDVEGHEHQVLEGSAHALHAHRIRHIVFEDHHGTGSRPMALLREAGYEIFSIGWSMRGPVLAPAVDGSLATAFEAPSYLATTETRAALDACAPTGWLHASASGARRRGERVAMSTRSLRTLRPTTGWVSIDLHELAEFRDLLLEFARRDIKLRYRQTVLGIAWVVLQPLIAAGVLNFAFGIVAGARPPGGSYFLFTFAGLLAWNLFSMTLSKTSLSLVGNSYLVSKVYFPRLILPLSGTLSTLLDFAVALGGLRRAAGVLRIRRLSRSSVLLPIWIGLILCLALGAGLIAAALTVKYRDIQHILPIVIPFMLYASPVAYDVTQIPAGYQTAFYLVNPLAALIAGLRASLLPGSALPPLRVRRRGRRPSRWRCSCSAPPFSNGPNEALPMSSSELAISIRGVGKKYTIRHDYTAPTTLAEAIVRRVRHPFARAEREQFWALKDVTFDVRARRGARPDRQQRRGQEHAAEDSVAHHRDVRRAKSISTAASEAFSKWARDSTRS